VRLRLAWFVCDEDAERSTDLRGFLRKFVIGAEFVRDAFHRLLSAHGALRRGVHSGMPSVDRIPVHADTYPGAAKPRENHIFDFRRRYLLFLVGLKDHAAFGVHSRRWEPFCRPWNNGTGYQGYPIGCAFSARLDHIARPMIPNFERVHLHQIGGRMTGYQ
jgi:hypothetical protein